MKKYICLLTCLMVIGFAGDVSAQNMIREGTQELGLSGNIDFEGPGGGVDIAATGRYGLFVSPLLELGGLASFARVADGDLTRVGAGIFGEYHFKVDPKLFPYVGSDAELVYADIDNGDNDDETTFVLTPKVGIKYFFRDYVAVDANLFVAWASDDIYFNDDELEDTDTGMNLGLRIYF